jgi:hypothetical protein
MYSGLQRKPRLWFLGNALQLLHHLHSVTHDYHCTRCAQGFVFAPLWGVSLPLPVFTSTAISLPCQHASMSGKPLRCPHVPRIRATHAPRFRR